MLMATMLSIVRSGRCFRFSTTSLLINLLVGYDYALWRRRELTHLAAREAGVAEHPIVFRERVGIAMRRAAQHHHAETGVDWRRDAIFVRNELQRDDNATGGHGRMHLL